MQLKIELFFQFLGVGFKEQVLDLTGTNALIFLWKQKQEPKLKQSMNVF